MELRQLELALDQVPQLSPLTQTLRNRANNLDRNSAWPVENVQLLADAGILDGLISKRFGGQEWDERLQLGVYLALGRSCLTTAFALTQWHAAVRRIEISSKSIELGDWLRRLRRGEQWTTVGISHLTTSRQHLSAPVLKAVETSNGFVLNGYSPWVTGGAHADRIVVGATLEDGRQILALVPRDRPGVLAHPGQALVALSSSCTDRIDFQQVEIDESEVLDGPTEQVMRRGSGGTGGLQTSILAIALSLAAIEHLDAQCEHRPDLRTVTSALKDDLHAAANSADLLAQGNLTVSMERLRQSANSLALRSTQAALAATKGAGFVSSHEVGRWCREALFFLVWSCPQGVVQAQLCELAGLA